VTPDTLPVTNLQGENTVLRGIGGTVYNGSCGGEVMLKKITAICIVAILVFGGLPAYYHFKRIPDIKEALGEVRNTPYKSIESRENYDLKEMEHILAWLRLAKVPDELRRKYANNTHRDRDLDIINQQLFDFHTKAIVTLESKVTIARTVRNISLGIVVLAVLTVIGCGVVGLWRGGRKTQSKEKTPVTHKL